MNAEDLRSVHMPVAIRTARPDEHGAISRLLYDTYAALRPPAHASPAYQASYEAYLQHVADVGARLEGTELIVAEDEGTIVGVVTFYPPGGPVAAPPDAQTPFPSTWAMFRLLAVASDRRGTGLGRALTETCLSRARTAGATHLALHTSDVMALARAMYLRMGWQRAPQYDFYPVPELCVEAYSLAL